MNQSQYRSANALRLFFLSFSATCLPYGNAWAAGLLIHEAGSVASDREPIALLSTPAAISGLPAAHTGRKQEADDGHSAHAAYTSFWLGEPSMKRSGETLSGTHRDGAPHVLGTGVTWHF
ncbi:hypothetical protein NK553_20280 [Pseudomonas sp. ZM23]|uniref:Uncharacterized protein n=1 Tax=Pseudomonas triclosanedens TaxID=2961893 RepID=A0ABY7A4Y4_9PSED|nr:hypothetical protein [Pseudomonas triclosanedens]MCP8466296.1 hypothetical protein [Pseudomonas triclosanedens]MCP8471822.1 hypothetical protein [Pseudomonas triclosanedens]MCP8478517.1 hypothetical protein [Pseudomonas triclosanedens]WAI52287.1 hypothetical protein OU419_13870 [Pseudomonas triclosanedens]